jgi:hypothetical protein
MIKLTHILLEVLSEKKEDRCKRIADRRYDKPSAYKSGAIVRCRQGKIWKKLKEYFPSDAGDLSKAYNEIRNLGVVNPLNPREIVIDDSVFIEISVFDKRLWFSSIMSLDKGQGNAGRAMQKIVDIADKHNVTIALDPLPFGNNPDKLNYNQLVQFYKKFGFKFEEGEEGFGDMERVAKPSLKEDESLHKWFKRKGGPGKEGGWVDCNTCREVDGKKKCKPCGRKEGEKRAKYPSCRPTPAGCKKKGKGKTWGKTK